MTAVIIRKKDVERLGKEVLKEVYDFLHNDYILTNFEEMKIEQEKFQHNLILYDFRSRNFTETQKENHFTKNYFDIDKNKYEEELKKLKDKIENGTFTTDLIYHTLIDINLESEIDEDLSIKKEAFLEIYRVISYQYEYLEK